MARSIVFAVCTFLAIILVPPHLFAFSIRNHSTISREALEPIEVTVEGEVLRFSALAIDEIIDANVDVDDPHTAALFFPEGHFTNEDFNAATSRLLTLRMEVVSSVEAEEPDGARGRSLIGQALHTIQDFYAHSNWLEGGHGSINSAFGRHTLADPPSTLQPCPADPNVLGAGGGGGETSGYFVGLLPPTGCGDLDHFGKCYHGNYSSDCVGINKDLDATEAAQHGVPSSPFHGPASNLAKEASSDFVELVLTDLAGNEAALRALLDARGSVGFVIDDTGSMGEEIDGVKLVVQAIVQTLDVLDVLRPPNWVLERFGDPDVGPPFVTHDADTLLAAVDALSAVGGGDCPELGMSALLEAVDAAYPDSTLFLFTDASAKDGPLVNLVIARAAARNTRIMPVLTGNCGLIADTGGQEGQEGSRFGTPVDPDYLRVALETGGQLVSVAPSELVDLQQLFLQRVTDDLRPIVLASGELAAGTSKSFEIPVDATVSGLLISVGFDPGGEITLFRPSGVPVHPGDPGVEITDISSGRILSIENPEVGTWALAVDSAGAYSVDASGNTPLAFRRFTFVEPNSDIHGGFVPLHGQPVVGGSGLAEATLLGPFDEAAFQLVDLEGNVLKEIDLVTDYPSAIPDRFVGELSVPDGAFRVQALGTTATGSPFLRTFPRVFQAQAVQVTVAPGIEGLVRPGETVDLPFLVTNLGPEATFELSTVADLGAETALSKETMVLGPGGEGTVVVTLTVPEDAPTFSRLGLTLTATHSELPEVFNSAAVELLVGRGEGEPVPSVLEIPTVSTWGLAIFALLLVVVACRQLLSTR